MDLRRDAIQNQAVDAWFYANKKGTIELHTGLGKNFCVFKILQQSPQITNVLFLSETSVREQNVRADFNAFLQFHKFDVSNLNWVFACYQGAYKHTLLDYIPIATTENTLIVCDEIHDMLTDKYIGFFADQPGILDYPIVGLTATVDTTRKYLIRGVETTKRELLDQFVPSIYKYGLTDSIQNGTSRTNLRFFIVEHPLDNNVKSIEVKTAKYHFFTTEFESYTRHHNPAVSKALFSKKDFLIRKAAGARKTFLHTLPSKRTAINKIIPLLRGKTLIFGKNNPELLKLCPNAIVTNNSQWEKDLDDFIAGRTRISASNLLLKQGANIPELDNIILHSYYSSETDFIQMVGRLRQSNRPGNVIIFKTINTQEEVWLKKLLTNLGEIQFISCTLTTLLNSL